MSELFQFFLISSVIPGPGTKLANVRDILAITASFICLMFMYFTEWLDRDPWLNPLTENDNSSIKSTVLWLTGWDRRLCTTWIDDKKAFVWYEFYSYQMWNQCVYVVLLKATQSLRSNPEKSKNVFHYASLCINEDRKTSGEHPSRLGLEWSLQLLLIYAFHSRRFFSEMFSQQEIPWQDAEEDMM